MSSLQPREITSETVRIAAKSQIIGNNGQILSKNFCTRKVKSHISVKVGYGAVLCDWSPVEAGNEMVFGVPFWSNAVHIGGVDLGSSELQEDKSYPLICNKAAAAESMTQFISVFTQLLFPATSVDMMESCRCVIEETRSIDSRIPFTCSIISAN
ncbi:hypothetical protein EIK77_010180 [Talaromyces pinophilus]|nr:hypothetical protein EIK77_010180 [Talaromyces pinophilus]